MNQPLTPAAALAFIFAGKATFTLRSKVTGAHFTYRVDQSRDGKLFFVKVVDHGSKVYAGLIPAGTISFRTTRGAKVPSSHPAVRALEWFLANQDSPQVEVHHAGQCGRCGRKLTHPESIATGFGPECAKLAA